MRINVIYLLPGSESGERRTRPKSEFILPLAEYHVTSRRNQQRPQSMNIDEIYHQSNVSRTSSNEMNDRNSIPENSRKISIASNQSTGLSFLTMCLFNIILRFINLMYQSDLPI